MPPPLPKKEKDVGPEMNWNPSPSEIRLLVPSFYLVLYILYEKEIDGPHSWVAYQPKYQPLSQPSQAAVSDLNLVLRILKIQHVPIVLHNPGAPLLNFTGIRK